MTQSTRTVILAQVFISAMMAGFMTGVFGFLSLGATPAFLTQWGHSFIVAWPVAFAASLVIGPLAFRMASGLNRLLP